MEIESEVKIVHPFGIADIIYVGTVHPAYQPELYLVSVQCISQQDRYQNLGIKCTEPVEEMRKERSLIDFS